MNNLTVTSTFILFYFLCAFIVLIISIIIFKIIKERGKKIKIQGENNLKKKLGLAANKIGEIQDENVKDQHHRKIYSIYPKDAILSRTELSELKSQSINEKANKKYQKYLGLGYNKHDKDIEQGDSIWR